MDRLVNVALKIAHNGGTLTYRVPNTANIDLFGKRVKVNLKKKTLTGVIIGEATPTEPSDFAIKDILEIIDDRPVITKEQLALMQFCAKYYFNPLGTTVHLAIPKDEKAPRMGPEWPKTENYAPEALSLEQADAANRILSERAGAYLLEGVTGSGKTHVYLKVAQETLRENRSVLFLVPEISLTPHLVERVQASLGIKAITMHSNVTPQKKRDAIFAMLRGHARVVIGARSAIFAPLLDLGLIVVDEEHDSSFKQDESPQYHARDLALWRARHESTRIILGSATPSLESVWNVEKGKLTHLSLRNRYQSNRALPEVTIIDLKEREHDVDFRTADQSISAGQKMCILSKPLREAIGATLENNQQVLLFLNQRGYAKFGVCYQCGHMVSCPNCSVGLTYYQKRRSLLCHQCKHSELAQTTCRNCKNDAVKFLGLGTERLEEEVLTLFPGRHVLRLDRDAVQSQKRLEETLSAMHERRADILIGTQMIAKGHDFLHVGLVGVVCADVALSMADFRAAEKTFQLLTQVAGRAGRGDFAGRAIIQTFYPQAPSIIFAKDHNVKDFTAQELAIRRRFMNPPFSRAALVRAEHGDPAASLEIVSKAKVILARESRLTILGPAPSPIEKINQRYRHQFLVMAQDTSVLHHALLEMQRNAQLSGLIAKKRARFIVDVDPYNLS